MTQDEFENGGDTSENTRRGGDEARVREAVAAFHEFAAAGGTDTQAFLAKHERLADLLVPMLEDETEFDPLTRSVLEPLPAPDMVLDDFRLLREIGRGGMGIVFEAQQLSLKRRVALKVLPKSLGLSEVRIERFRRESAAAARVKHPGVLPIYSVGEANGTHFFAMELVEGPSLDAVLHAARNESEPASGSRLGILAAVGRVPEVAGVILQIAEGLVEAHRNGVIHRDIKPQNILIDRRADPAQSVRIVDFGLAKDLDMATVSLTEDVAGTPEYMSPEQVSGLRLVQAPSDIYSLGIVLYECLTLEKPFRRESVQRVLHAVVHEDPPSVRTIDPSIPHDMDVICTKATEKNPADRYATMDEFAADLRRFLRHEPIHAQPPSFLRRLGKAARRNRVTVGVIGVAVLVLVLGAIGYSIHLAVAAQVFAQGQEETEAQRRRAEESVDNARSALNRMLAQVEAMGLAPNVENWHRKAAEDVVAHLEEFSVSELGDSEQDIDLILLAARARGRLAKTYHWIGDHEATLRQLTASDFALSEVRARSPEHPRLPAFVAVNAQARGMALAEQEKIVEARSEFDRALAAWDQTDPNRLSPEHRAELSLGRARDAFHRSRLLTRPNAGTNSSRARELLDEADRFVDQIPGESAAKLRYRHLIAIHRAALMMQTATPEAALVAAKRAVACGERRNAKNPRAIRDLAVSRRLLGSMIRVIPGRVEDAAKLFRDSCEPLTLLVDGYPSTRSFRLQLARVLLDRASIEGELGHEDESREFAHEVATVLGAESPDEPLESRRLRARGVVFEALCDLQSGKPKPARAALLRAATSFESLVDTQPESPIFRHDLAFTLHHLALAEKNADLEVESCESIRRAVLQHREAVRLNPENRVFRRELRTRLGLRAELLIWHGDHAEAAKACEEFRSVVEDDGKAVLSVGTMLAICMRYASMDLVLNDADREEILDDYAEKAMSALERAVALGYRGARNLRTSRNFEVLRTRDAFQDLLRKVDELRAKRAARRK